MVTVIVGDTFVSEFCEVTTLAKGIDGKPTVKFQNVTNNNKKINENLPHWATYVQGVTALFKGIWCHFYVK